MAYPSIGETVLCRPVPKDAFTRWTARPARTLDDFHMVSAIRSAVFLSEQDCPYEEEFDGNDLCATHFLLFEGRHPVGTLRIRWFAGFAKLERVVLLKTQRARAGLKVLLAEAFELTTRKGYRLMIAQIQSRLWPFWERTFKCRLIESREPFWFSDFEYYEIEIPLPAHPQAMRASADPFMMIRPEGQWDTAGVLDRSSQRSPKKVEAA